MHTIQTIIRDVARRGTSHYGNPTLTIHTDSGEYVTQANTSWAYEAMNPQWRDAPVTLHLNQYGRVRWATQATTLPKEENVDHPPTKTTCPEHRRQGYAFVAGLMVCRGCGLPADHHETIDETMARRATSEWALS